MEVEHTPDSLEVDLGSFAAVIILEDREMKFASSLATYLGRYTFHLNFEMDVGRLVAREPG